MQLSESTMEILKNFASINQGLIVKKGTYGLKTLSTDRTIKGEAEIKEDFDQDFAIYDLNKTLGLLSLNKKETPEIVLEKEFLTITGIAGKGKIRQRFSSPNLVYGYDKLDKQVNVTSFNVNFVFTQEIYNWITSVASVLKCPNIVIKSIDGKTIEIFAEDVKGVIVDDASIEISGATEGKPFQAVMKIENLKIIPGDYNVAISSGGITKFTHQTKPILYWISLEQGVSKF